MVMQQQRPVGYTEDGTIGSLQQDQPVYGPTGTQQFGAPLSGVDPLADTTPLPPADPNAGLDPMTGFASRYSPALAPQAYENPWFILEDVFPGISTSSPMFQALRDMGADPLTLYNIIMGSQRSASMAGGEEGGAESDFINWLANMYQERGTPGGSTFNAGELIRTLFGQDLSEGEPRTSLGAILEAGDQSTQVRTLFNLLRDVSNVGMNPLASRGYQSAIAQAGDRYGNAMMKAEGGDTLNPSTWIAQNMPWLAGR